MQSGFTSVALYYTLRLFFPDELEPIDGGPQPGLSRLAHTVEAVELYIKENRDDVGRRAPISGAGGSAVPAGGLKSTAQAATSGA